MAGWLPKKQKIGVPLLPACIRDRLRRGSETDMTFSFMGGGDVNISNPTHGTPEDIHSAWKNGTQSASSGGKKVHLTSAEVENTQQTAKFKSPTADTGKADGADSEKMSFLLTGEPGHERQRTARNSLRLAIQTSCALQEAFCVAS